MPSAHFEGGMRIARFDRCRHRDLLPLTLARAKASPDAEPGPERAPKIWKPHLHGPVRTAKIAARASIGHGVTDGSAVTRSVGGATSSFVIIGWAGRPAHVRLVG